MVSRSKVRVRMIQQRGRCPELDHVGTPLNRRLWPSSTGNEARGMLRPWWHSVGEDTVALTGHGMAQSAPMRAQRRAGLRGYRRTPTGKRGPVGGGVYAGRHAAP